MLSLILAGIFLLFTTFTLIIIIGNKPDIWFWLFLNLFFDPGGYVEGYLGGNLFGLLNVSDIFILGIVICVISAKFNWQEIFKDKFLSRFLLFLFIYSLYYFIVYGGVIPYIKNDYNYPVFLLKSRIYIYGIIILISVYAFSLKGLRYFYTVTLSISFICLTLYWVTLITGINLVPVIEIPRYDGAGPLRITMLSYGLFELVFPLALIIYLLSRRLFLKINYKALLYYCGVMMLATLLITLTRRVQIEILGTIILLIFIISYLFRTVKLVTMLKLLLPAALVVLVLNFTFPKYVGYITKVVDDTYLLFTTGKDTMGRTEYRVSGTGDLKNVKKYIDENLLFGSGYTYLYWQSEDKAISPRGRTFARAADAADEVPIYNSIFSYGIAGSILMIPLYYIMAKLFFNLLKLLKTKMINYLYDPLTLIFAIYILLTVGGIFTFDLYKISVDFTSSHMCVTGVFMGLGLALYRKLLGQSQDILKI